MINKSIFNLGGCSSFAEVFLDKYKEIIPNLELGIIRGKIKLDDYEQYGDTEWVDCHAVVMLNDEYYFDVDGLIEFNENNKKFVFGPGILEVQLIKLNDINYDKNEYSIYNEFENLEKNIHITFGNVLDNGELNIKQINKYKEKANKYIDLNQMFFEKEIEDGINILNKNIEFILN